MDGAHRGRSTSKARRPPTTATTTRQSRHEQNPDKAKLTTTPSASLNAKVIIFALYESRVYVPIPETFDEAIDLAYETFPSHLAHVFRNRIGFSVKRLVDNRYSQVAISSKAWRAVAAGMTQYEVIYVDVSHRRPPRPSPSLEQQQADLTSSSGRSSHPPHSRSQSPGPYNSGSSRSSSVSSSSSSRYDVRSTHERSVDGPVGGGEGDHGQLTLDEITVKIQRSGAHRVHRRYANNPAPRELCPRAPSLGTQRQGPKCPKEAAQRVLQVPRAHPAGPEPRR
ncbi:hypothetical protein BC835DRAFT_486640 [Cytidiella melzeri]|nr:hypothetical protein BC835DRAFT_486640 [Cytidiella melzeri]